MQVVVAMIKFSQLLAQPNACVVAMAKALPCTKFDHDARTAFLGMMEADIVEMLYQCYTSIGSIAYSIWAIGTRGCWEFGH